MPILFTGSSFKALVRGAAVELAETVASRATSHTPQTYVEPVFSLLGTTKTNHERICEALRSAARRFSGNAREIGRYCVEPRVRFSASDLGVLIFYRGGGLARDDHLTTFLPYLTTHGADDLYFLILRSFSTSGHGRIASGFKDAEISFLETTAIPAIVGHKIRTAREKGENLIEFYIKIFGVGEKGAELPSIMKSLFNHLACRKNFQGAISVRCAGFDLSHYVIHDTEGWIRPAIAGTARRSPVQERLQVSYDCYFGDLADRMTLSAMQTFGQADFALWRNTHIMYFRVVLPEWGQGIVRGMRNSLNRPGSLLVDEGLPTPDQMAADFFIQELLTG